MFAIVNTLNHVPVEGDGSQYTHPAICLSLREHVLQFWGHLFTHLANIFSPSPGLEGPWDPGMSQSLGACRVPMGLSSPLSSHSLVTLVSQSWPSSLWLLPFLFVLDPFPRSSRCLKPVSPGVYSSCASSCAVQRMATHFIPLPTGTMY